MIWLCLRVMDVCTAGIWGEVGEEREAEGEQDILTCCRVVWREGEGCRVLFQSKR